MTVDQEVSLTRWLVIAAVVCLIVLAGVALYTFALDSLVNFLT
jgi:hypothetical protein